MVQTIRRPEEILAYRTLQQILVSKPKELWTAGPADTVLTALQTMADKDVNLIVVLDQRRLVGVVSERDCARRAVLAKKPLETTPVSDIMTREVVTVDFSHTYRRLPKANASTRNSPSTGGRPRQCNCRSIDSGSAEGSGRT